MTPIETRVEALEMLLGGFVLLWYQHDADRLRTIRDATAQIPDPSKVTPLRPKAVVMDEITPQTRDEALRLLDRWIETAERVTLERAPRIQPL